MSKLEVSLFTALPYIPDAAAVMSDFQELLNSKVFTNRGPWVHRFENEISEYLGSGLNVVSCSNATMAQELVLKAFGLKGKVIVPSFTFVATVHAIVNAGLEPVFADIDPHSLCLSPESVERAITPDTCAVVPVHVFGRVSDLSYFESLRARGIKVVYDAAHAFGVRAHGTSVGANGDAETFSFHATKILNACEGGAIVTRDPLLARKLKLMSNFGIVNEDEIECIGTNAKLSEVHAIFGIHSLKNLPEAIRIRTALCSRYRERMREISVRFPEPQNGVTENGQYFPIILETKQVRDGLYESLRKSDIFARKYFHPAIHRVKAYSQMAPADLPVTENIADRILCLPIHSAMQPHHVDLVSDEISRFLGGR